MKPERQLSRDIFKLHAPFAPLLERVYGLRRCAAIYDNIVQGRDEGYFPARVLERMAIGYDLADEEFGRIPAQGPLVVIANHPFGGVERMILLDLLQRARPDVRVLANFLLCRIPELRQAIIPVDPFGGRSATAANRRPLREAIRWVRWWRSAADFPRRRGRAVQPGAPRDLRSPMATPSGALASRLRRAGLAGLLSRA